MILRMAGVEGLIALMRLAEASRRNRPRLPEPGREPRTVANDDEKES